MGQAKLRGSKKQRILTSSKKWGSMKNEIKALAQLKRGIKIDELQKNHKELCSLLWRIKKE